MATKSGIFLSVAAGLIVTSAIALGGWNLNKTAAIPETYATKVELKEKIADVKDESDSEDKEIRQEIRDKMTDMMTEQRYVRKAVDDLNKYLRDINK